MGLDLFFCSTYRAGAQTSSKEECYYSSTTLAYLRSRPPTYLIIVCSSHS